MAKRIFTLLFVGILAAGLVYAAVLGYSGGDISLLDKKYGIFSSLPGTRGLYSQEEYTFEPDGISGVSITELARDIYIDISPDDDVHVVCWESGKEKYTITADNSLFSIKAPTDKAAVWGISEGTSLLIQLPSGMNAGVTVTAGSGSVYVSPMSVYLLNIITVSGDVIADNISSDTTADFSTVSGSVSLSFLSAEYLTVSTDSGSVTVGDADITADMSVTTSSGSVTCTMAGHPEDYAVSTDTASGSVSVQDGAGGGRIPVRVRTVSGDIQVVFSK